MTHPPESWARGDLEFLVSVTVCDQSGHLLDRFDAEVPLELGDRLVLSGPRVVEVVACQESIRTSGWFQLVDVADVPADEGPGARVLSLDDPMLSLRGDWSHVLVTVRDARFGRDPGLSNLDGGQVLDQFRFDQPLGIGEHVLLPDGSEARVVASREVQTPADWLQTVEVGDVWPTQDVVQLPPPEGL